MKKTVTSGGRGEDSRGGAGKGVSNSSYSEYKRYEQKGNVTEKKINLIKVPIMYQNIKLTKVTQRNKQKGNYLFLER